MTTLEERERNRVKAVRYRQKLKRDLFDAYGWKCACCGEARPEFLTIDHVEGGGAAERRARETYTIWAEIRRQGFPPTFRTLCWNCNCARHIHGVCPHERERTTLRAVA